jgi:hypothetical protein
VSAHVIWPLGENHSDLLVLVAIQRNQYCRLSPGWVLDRI